MGQQPAPVTGREVVNYDGVWGDCADPRWYHIGDGEHRVSLGRNGIAQAVVTYALSGVGLAFILHKLPVLNALVARPGWWLWALVLGVLFAAAAKVRPGGLAMHVYLPVVLADAFAPRHCFGWVACEDPDAAWRCDELPICRESR